MNRQREWIALTVILLLAAGLRLWRLGSVPPGLSHDEVANWLIAHDILDGNHAIYFTAAYGHEPLYQYAQAATVALFGDHWLALRWPSVAFGLLGITATYILIRRLFGAHVALLTAAGLGVGFWPLFYARVAYRAILLPFTAALSTYFLARVIPQPSRGLTRRPGHRSVHVLLAGLFLGLSVYTYPAARILPFILAAAVVYARLVRPALSIPWSRILLVFLAGATISAPLWLWLAAHPGAEYRVAEVREPLDRLLSWDLSLAWQNLIANLKFFTIHGDPWARYNIPGRPVFAEPVGAVLFIAGVLIALWRWREPRHGLLLIWLIGSLAPSVVTSDPPSSIRSILGLVVTFVFPALALVELAHWLKRRSPALRTGAARRDSLVVRLVRCAPSAACILFLSTSLLSTARDYFVRWPQNEVARFDHQADLTAVAEWLEGLPPEAAVAVSGLSPHTMDKPTLELASRREVANVRLCDTRETVIIPSSPGGDAWLLIPQIVPFDKHLRQQLMKWGARQTPKPSFTSYRLSDVAHLRQGLTQLETAVILPDGRSLSLPVSFGGHLTFLGYRAPDRTNPDDPLTLLTYWGVEDPPAAQLKVFAHLIDASGELIAQDDGLASPSDSWRAKDIIVQNHVLSVRSGSSLPSAGAMRIGVYKLPTNSRLPVLGADHVELVLQAGW